MKWRSVTVAVAGALVVAGVAWARPFLTGVFFEREYWRVVADVHETKSLRLDPTFHKLPPQHRLLVDGKWATTGTDDFLLKLRRDYPGDATLLDYYRACWDFWNKNYAAAETTFRAQGREVELVRTVAARGDRDRLRQLAETATNHEARAQAWWELARQSGVASAVSADRRDNANRPGTGDATAAGCLVRALSYSGRAEIWEAVRARVGQDISHAEYAAALRELALRTRSGDVAEQIALELGKLKVVSR